MDLVKELQDASIAHIKIPSPEKMLADVQKTVIREGKQMLILIKDTTIVRLQEKKYTTEKL